jgi:hypothetical protein
MWHSRVWVGRLFLMACLAGPVLSDENKVLSLGTVQDALGVSEKLAHVTDAYLPSDIVTVPDFILIQDVHHHPQVQSQIATLIIHGYDDWGVKKVFLEGAFTPLDMTVFHRVPNRTRAALMERLVKDGDLSGPEWAAILIMEREWRNPPVSPFQLFGMEEPTLYRENVQAYQTVLLERGKALEDLVTLRRQQASLHLPELNLLDEQLIRMDALLRLKLTPSQYEEYLQAKDAVPATPALKPAIQAAEEFYRVAELRSQVFLKEAFHRVPASTAPRIIVVGGFHTAEMARLLRREGRSFVVFSPLVNALEDDPMYERHLQQTVNLLAQVPAASRR